jgi:hypothetical protein
MQSSDIIDIINTAQKFNKSINVTGMLMFVAENFIQYLEGAEEDVLMLYNKIAKDRRHVNCQVILQGRSGVNYRHFANWNMGLKIITEQDLKDIRDLNKNPNFDLFEELNNHPDIAKQLMKHFYNHGEINFREFWTSSNNISDSTNL